MKELKERAKVVNRRIFSHEEKQKILNKSKGVCSHCGKKVKIGENFSIEHVVPLSEGGNNDIENCVALCKECNLKKLSSVYDIESYYRYLTKSVKKEVKAYFDKWLTRFETVSATNLCTTDKVKFNEWVCSPKSYKFFERPSYIDKAYYSDLNNLYLMLKERGMKDPKAYISNYFEKGSIYIKKSGNDNISFAFFFQFVYSRKEMGNSTHSLPVLSVKTWVNKRALDFTTNTTHIAFGNGVVNALNSIIKISTEIVGKLSGTYSLPILLIDDFEHSDILEKTTRGIIVRDGNGLNSCKRLDFRLSIVKDTEVEVVLKNYIESYVKELGVSYSWLPNDFTGFMFDTARRTMDSMLSTNWSKSYNLYKDLNIFNINEYLVKYCSDMSLEEVLKLNLEIEDYDMVNSYLSQYSLVLSEVGENEVEEFMLSINEIVIPEDVNKSETLPTFMKVAIRGGDIRRVRVDSNNVLINKKYNYALYKFYKDSKKKSIPCMKKSVRKSLKV